MYQPETNKADDYTIMLPWYERADYDVLCATLADGSAMPDYEGWMAQNKRLETGALVAGKQIVRTPIRQLEFLAWCEGFTKPNRAALDLYVKLKAKQGKADRLRAEAAGVM
jgi:hypothetical protein